MKLAALLRGLQLGYNKHRCFCVNGTADKKNHYIKTVAEKRLADSREEKPLVNPEQIYSSLCTSK
jgi:hypothetical protein